MKLITATTARKRRAGSDRSPTRPDRPRVQPLHLLRRQHAAPGAGYFPAPRRSAHRRPGPPSRQSLRFKNKMQRAASGVTTMTAVVPTECKAMTVGAAVVSAERSEYAIGRATAVMVSQFGSALNAVLTAVSYPTGQAAMPVRTALLRHLSIGPSRSAIGELCTTEVAFSSIVGRDDGSANHPEVPALGPVTTSGLDVQLNVDCYTPSLASVASRASMARRHAAA
jgi:hypothetical protein